MNVKFEESVLREFFERDYPDLEFGKLKTEPRETEEYFCTVDLIYDEKYLCSFFRSAYGDDCFYTPISRKRNSNHTLQQEVHL